MITGFISGVLPQLLDRLEELVRESAVFRLLCALWRLFTESLFYRAVRAGYRRIRDLCRGSLTGRLLARHPDEGAVYDGSLLAAGFDRLMSGLSRLLRRLIGLLTFGTYDSAVLSLGRRALARLPWLDTEALTGIAILFLLLCPSELWRNVYALVLALALTALLLVSAALRGRPALRLRTLGLPLAAFAFSTVVGIGTAADRSEALRVFAFFLSAFLLCASVAGIADNEKKLRKLLGFVYAGVVIAAAVAVAQRFMGVQADPTLTDLSVNQGMPGRVYSVYENPNNYAEIIVLLFPAAAAWALALPERSRRICAAAGLALPVAALLMTYSRGEWISFALMALVFLFFCRRQVLPLIPLLALLAIPLLPQSIFNRILTIGSTADTSNMYRIYIWSGVLDLLRDYGLTGIGLGPGNFRPIYQLYCLPAAAPAPHAHMLYLELWVELGLLGILSYLVYYFSTIRNAVIRMPQASRPVRLFLIAGVSALAGIAFASAAEYIWFYPRVLFCFFLLTGLMAAAVELTRGQAAGDPA